MEDYCRSGMEGTMDARRLAHYAHYSRPRCELSRVFTDGDCGGREEGFIRVMGMILYLQRKCLLSVSLEREMMPFTVSELQWEVPSLHDP